MLRSLAKASHGIAFRRLVVLTVCHSFHIFYLSLTDFRNFPAPVTLFQNFPVLENATVKFQDFPVENATVKLQDFPGFPGPLRTLRVLVADSALHELDE